MTEPPSTHVGRRIDSHHHLWDLAVRDQPWTAPFPALSRSFSMEDLQPDLVAESIDATVLIQTVAIAHETPEMLGMARTDPHIVGVVGWVDLTAADVGDRLAELADPLLVGIRHLAEAESDPQWLNRPQVRRGIAAVGAAGMVYDLLVRPPQLPAAIALAQALPEVSFVLDHAGKPLIEQGTMEPWREQVKTLSAQPNVAVKLSGLVTEAGRDFTAETFAPYSDHLLDSFGPSRVMFGSDWPVCLLAASYPDVVDIAEILTTALSPTERELVFGGTAIAWYGLK